MVEEEEAASSGEAIQLTDPLKRTRQHVIEVLWFKNTVTTIKKQATDL
jgi:hypothetical protein